MTAQPALKYERKEDGSVEEIEKIDPLHPSVTNRLFVYGIFLDQDSRDYYGMTNPRYCTVPGYITVGSHIVQAVAVDEQRIALTGLTVDMDPEGWEKLDRLEGGYDRSVVTTIAGEQVYMYTQPERRKNERY